jgi:hypothetical protein
MQLRELVLLQQAVDELCPYIVAVVSEDGALQEHLGTAGDIVFALEVLVAGFGHQVEP